MAKKQLKDSNPLIESINTESSKGIIFAWFLGLAIFSWFNSSVSLGLVTNIILAAGNSKRMHEINKLLIKINNYTFPQLFVENIYRISSINKN